MRYIKRIVLSFYWRVLNLSKKKVAMILAISLVLSVILTTVQGISSSYINSMIVTLNYEGAKEGLNPDGSRFNISEIVSDEVLKKAISVMGDNSLTVEGLKSRITIDSKMPLSAIEKTTAAIASGSNYRYNPSEFDVYYSQKKKLAKNRTIDFIHALSKAYNEYFFNKYSEKNVILEFDISTAFGDYDYYEIQRVLSDKIGSMITYLSKHHGESPAFRSEDTGYTFENLTNMLINLRDQDLEKLRAYIIQNRISNDTGEFIRKQQYLADKKLMQYESSIQASEISKSALEIYDPFITGIAFIPSVDKQSEYYMSRTKTGLDNLAMRSYNAGIDANIFKKAIDEKNYLVEKYTTDYAVDGDAAATADKMIEALCTNLEKISSVALMTDSEYLENKTKNYITFNLPSKGFSLPLSRFAVNFVIILFLVTLAFRLYFVTPMFIKWRIERIKEKIDSEESKEELQEEEAKL